MPRNGSGIYSLPSNTVAVPNTKIQSSKYNSVNADIEQDLNTPRPVVAGGTGASSATNARTNLSVDKKVVYAQKTADYTAVADDNNACFRFTSTATLGLTAVATLGANWHLMVIADGGDVTVDPNSTELIDGVSTIRIPSGYSTIIVSDGSAFFTAKFTSTAKIADLQGNLFGLTISNNAGDITNDIDVAAGRASDINAGDMMVLASAMTKRLDAVWAAGSGQGGLDVGSPVNGTYHVFLIKRPDTGNVDVLLSASATAPTLPANYTLKRRIGAIIRAGGTILAFKQRGNQFLLDVPVLDLDVGGQGTTGVSRTLGSIPSGIQVDALMRARATNTAGFAVLVTSLDIADAAPSFSAAPGGDLVAGANEVARAVLSVRTNTSSQVRTRSTVASTDIKIVTLGWIDTRDS